MAGSYYHNYASGILLCLLVAISRLGSIDAAYSMAETCAYIPKGYIGDPTNCQNWGYCQGGSLVATGTCSAGLLFDSKTSMCNYAKDVSCLSTIENACSVATEPGYIGDPNNCNRYGYCVNGKLSYFNCPQYQVFNPELNKCVWGREYSCPANSICRLVANNVFAGDPMRCGNYIRCQDGSGTSLQCGAGSLYNPSLGSCDPNYSCNSSPGETPGNPNIPATNPTICKTDYVTTTGGIQYFTDNLSCYGYYSCSSATEAGVWGSCPFATHFNPVKQECVTPYSYACPHDRCGNLNLNFVAQLGCAGYSVCSNQVTTSSGLCTDVSNGYDWFDEFGGGCVANKPSETICDSP